MLSTKSLSFQNRNRDFSYASSGVDRRSREVSRKRIARDLKTGLKHTSSGTPLELPFGFVFPSNAENEYYDLQIEGVGTKTLLAELIGAYSTVGIDGVAMVVNDVIRSAARPYLVSDSIHISKSDETVVRQIMASVRKGAKEANCVLASGETGDVAEILHEPLVKSAGHPFDLMVACIGTVKSENVIDGLISDGDEVIAMQSSGIHSNGLSLARRILLQHWGGKFDAFHQSHSLGKPIIHELLEPTRIYVAPLMKANESVKIKAAVHITGDGFAKFFRLLDFQTRVRDGDRVRGFELNLRPPPGIFQLIFDTGKELGKPIRREEMYMTFNMGYGFAVVVSKAESEKVLDLFNRYFPAQKIGRAVARTGIKISVPKDRERPLILKRHAIK